MRLTIPYIIKKLSAWEFETFGSGGLSIGFVAGSGGQVILKDPSGAFQTFTYGGAGAGLSAGIKIPKIGKIQLPATGTLGPMAFPSRGIMFAAAGLPGGDLAKSDIQGPCMFCEVGGGIIGGASAIGI